MIRVFITGSYRKPRELNWIVGFSLLGITLILGFTGYSLVYEQLSYWGATVAGNITEAVPIIGIYMADFMRGGPSVTGATLSRFYIFHIVVLPALLGSFLIFHITMIRLLGVSELKFKNDSKDKKTFPFFPDHILTEIGIGITLMFLLTFFAIVFPAGLAEKANPLVTPAHIKPEWYFFFTFRWLKLTSLTFAVLSLGFAAFCVAMWPFIDSWLRRKNENNETSVFLGVVGVLIIVTLTLWETFVLFYSH